MSEKSPQLPMIIAIDGTAASGKGTLSRALAQDLDFAYLDTGKLYRYLGMAALDAGIDLEDQARVSDFATKHAPQILPHSLEDERLFSDEAGQAASKIATITDVRAALLSYQQNFAQIPPNEKRGAVLDGRDIGTVICPDAPVKLFITASAEIRAQRRFKELQSKGISVRYDAVLADMQERDARDQKRDEAPLKPAHDALMMDTSDVSADDVLNAARDYVRNRTGL
jgi:cytidylate kinase